MNDELSILKRPALLVSGGAGYIGSHVCKSLYEAGFLPVTIDNLSNGHRWAVKWGPLIVADISDNITVKKIISDFDIKGVLHFAGYSIVHESIINPLKYYDNNVIKALSFLSSIIECGIKCFVFSSTAAVYGNPTILPIPEDHPTNPVNPYGATKLAFETSLQWFESAYDFRYVILRYFNAAGSDTNAEIGEAHYPETHLIPNIILSSLNKSSSLIINGNDYPTLDGTAIRDYIHVTDLANAHVEAICHLLEGQKSLTLNVGTGIGTSINEIITCCTNILDDTIQYKIGARRIGDPPVLIADTTAIKQHFNWTPCHSKIDTIIKDTYKWYKKYGCNETSN